MEPKKEGGSTKKGSFWCENKSDLLPSQEAPRPGAAGEGVAGTAAGGSTAVPRNGEPLRAEMGLHFHVPFCPWGYSSFIPPQKKNGKSNAKQLRNQTQAGDPPCNGQVARFFLRGRARRAFPSRFRTRRRCRSSARALWSGPSRMPSRPRGGSRERDLGEVGRPQTTSPEMVLVMWGMVPQPTTHFRRVKNYDYNSPRRECQGGVPSNMTSKGSLQVEKFGLG